MAVVPAAERRCVEVLIDRSETLQLLRRIGDRAFDSARFTHGGWRVPYYTCSSYSNSGVAVCTNKMPLPMNGADRAVLECFSALLDPALL